MDNKLNNNKKTKILFVCMGNICRSPAAEEIFRQKVARAGLEHLYQTDSAGTYAGHKGELPDARMRLAASTRGYALTHRSRPFCYDDFLNFDMIVVMDDRNHDDVERLAFTIDDKARIYRMAEFCKDPHYDYVPDPYYEGPEGFELVLDLLEKGCDNLISFLQNHF